MQVRSRVLNDRHKALGSIPTPGGGQGLSPTLEKLRQTALLNQKGCISHMSKLRPLESLFNKHQAFHFKDLLQHFHPPPLFGIEVII